MSFVESFSLLEPCTGSAFCSHHAVTKASYAVDAGMALHLHRRGDVQRGEIESFVADVFARHYGARLTSFMPVLASLQGKGRPCAVAGYRSASEPLFLERYLPQPIELMLSAAAGRSIAREQIVEVGQFASRRAGEGRRLMGALGRHLADQGFRWVVMTATAELRRLFARMGLAPMMLASADPARLGAEARRWGSYYQHAPKVLAGDLAVSLPRLARPQR